MKRDYGEHFWAVPSLFNTARIYGCFFRMPGPMGVAAAVVLAVGLLCLPWMSPKADMQDEGVGANRREDALLLVLLALPVIGFAATKMTHGGFTGRYVLAGILAIPITIGCLVPKLNRRFLVATCFVPVHSNFVAGGFVLDEPLESGYQTSQSVSGA
jgi:hypothetical protein